MIEIMAKQQEEVVSVQEQQQQPQVVTASKSNGTQQTGIWKEGGILWSLIKDSRCKCASYPVVCLGAFGSLALCLGIILCAVGSDMLAVGLIFAAAGAVMIMFFCRLCDVPRQDYNTLNSDQPDRLSSCSGVALPSPSETESSTCYSPPESKSIDFPVLAGDGSPTYQEQSGELPLKTTGSFHIRHEGYSASYLHPSEVHSGSYSGSQGGMTPRNSFSLEEKTPSYSMLNGGMTNDFAAPVGGLTSNYSIPVGGPNTSYSLQPEELNLSYPVHSGGFSLPPGGPTSGFSVPRGPIVRYSAPHGGPSLSYSMSPVEPIHGYSVTPLAGYMGPSGDLEENFNPSYPSQIARDAPPPYTDAINDVPY